MSGGGSGTTDAGSPILQDGGLFVLISTTPPDGGTGISPLVAPTATFSATPDVATTTVNTLQLLSAYSGSPVPLSSVSSSGPTTLRMSPLDSLPRGTTVAIRVDP